jgi:hypothetical protein
MRVAWVTCLSGPPQVRTGTPPHLRTVRAGGLMTRAKHLVVEKSAKRQELFWPPQEPK